MTVLQTLQNINLLNKTKKVIIINNDGTHLTKLNKSGIIASENFYKNWIDAQVQKWEPTDDNKYIKITVIGNWL